MAHPLTLSSTPEHYTPPEWVERVRTVLGGIDLDPCSCAAAQKIVKAATYYTIDDNGLTKPWRGRVFINPPGDARGKLPRLFWDKLQAEVEAGHVESYVWLAFNISHLRTLRPAFDLIAVPHQRIRFTGDSPTKDNAFIAWGVDVTRFESVFAPVASCWCPTTYVTT